MNIGKILVGKLSETCRLCDVLNKNEQSPVTNVCGLDCHFISLKHTKMVYKCVSLCHTTKSWKD